MPLPVAKPVHGPSGRRRLVRLGVLAALALACAVMVVWWRTGPEQATNNVVLSADGWQWSTTLDEAFFASEEPWSPGQTRTAVFWVRNDADVRADVDLQLTSTAGQDLAHSGLLEVSAAIGDGEDGQSFLPDRDLNTVRVGELGPGERVAVTLRAVLAGAVDVDSASIRYAVSGSGASVEKPHWVLDGSGAHLELAPLFLGVGLLVTTVVMRRTGRRRTRPTRRP